MGTLEVELAQGEVWSGGVHVTLDCPCDMAWAIFADFGGLCKWNPTIAVCDLVEGKNNEPGSVRYCRGTLPDSWVYERLLVHDEENCLCKYQMEDNRFRFRDGVQGYVSQIKVWLHFPLSSLLRSIFSSISRGIAESEISRWCRILRKYTLPCRIGKHVLLRSKSG